MCDKFNAHLQGKLVVLVDDVDKLTKRQQDTLKTVTTQKNFKLEKKGLDSTKETCFFDTITTSNHPNNIWISKEDRRNEIVEVSDVRKQNKLNKPFWDEFYKGLEDYDVMKAVYDHCANFKIQLDIRNKTTRFDRETLQKRIADSLPSSIEFLRNMFEDVGYLDWHMRTRFIFPKGYIWISPTYLYRVFSQYLDNVGSRLKPNQKTFIKDLEAIGLEVHRKRCKELFEGQIRCLELSPRTIKEALQEEYGDVDVLQAGFENLMRNFQSPLTEEVSNKLFPTNGLL